MNAHSAAVDAAAARSTSASPTSILHFIRSSPSPPPAPPPPACPTCHAAPSFHPQLSAYSLYAHGLTSASPPAVLLPHMLPSPPPLMAHGSQGSQHLHSANSAYAQLVDAPYVFASAPDTRSHIPHTHPAQLYTQPSANSHTHTQAYSHYTPPYAAASQQPYQPPHFPLPTFQPPAALHADPYLPRYRRRLTSEEEQLANVKTEICRTHLTTGQCQFGLSCQYAHGFDELRPREYDSKYKTELCKRYHTLGASGCKFGARCKFLHDEQRIKAGDGEYWLCSVADSIIRVEVVPQHHYHRRQLLDQLTFFPPSGPVSPLSTSPIPPRRARRSLTPPPFAPEYAAGAVPTLASLPSFLAAAVSPAHSTRSVPASSSDGSGPTSTGSSSGSGGAGGLSYSMPARYRRVGDGEFVVRGRDEISTE